MTIINLKATPLLALALAASLSTARAQDTAPSPPSPPASTSSTSAAALPKATLWASGLEDPQGIVLDSNGSILVSEYGGGRIVRFSADGKKKTVAAKDLKGPTMLIRMGKTVLVAERKANRVARLNANGSVSPVGGAIEEPLGLAISDGTPVVISHTTSKVLRWDGKGKVWRQFFAASAKGRYGYRCLAAEPGGAMLMTDEKSGQVLVLTPRGRVAMWAKDFASPSGVAIGPDGHAYVTDEGDGGLYKITGDGTATQIAGELGRPRGILFLSAKAALIADRDGNVWRVPLS